MIYVVLFLLLIAALLLAAFCAGTESGFFSVSRGRVLHLVQEGSKTAKIVHSALSDMSRTVTSILIGNNLANVVFSASSAALASRFFYDSHFAQTVWTFCAACIILYAGEFLPKLFFSSRPLRRLLKVSSAFRIFSIIVSPLTKVAVWVTGLFVPKSEAKEQVTMNELLRILHDRKDGVRLTDFESVLISRIIILRRKGEFITVESLLQALDEEGEEF